MGSPTQQRLSPGTVADLARTGLARAGLDGAVQTCAELDGGGFAAVWRVDLDGGRAVVIKIGPRSDVALLGYEARMLRAEAEYLDLLARGAPEVPVPRMLHYSPGGDLVDGEWIVTTFLPGRPLPVLHAESPRVDDAPARRDLGRAVAVVHLITGERYGYSGERAHGPSWRAAFTAIVESLLADAAAWGVELPSPPARIRAALDRHGHLLDLVQRPALLHFDLWDGNVLVSVDEHGAARLTGLVDGERYLFGDPLVDLVSPVLFRRIEDEPGHPFLAGYADVTGEPIVLDEAAVRRLSLYRMHLDLVMTTEMPSRGMTTPADQERRECVAALLNEELTLLGV